MNNKIFRIDDIGASTKKFEQYGRWKIGNFWLLKTIKPFKGWGPYNELTPEKWKVFLEIFGQYNIRPIVAITAAWVEKDGSLTPFPEKFPKEAAFLKKALKEKKIEVANHGLTHCVAGKHLPKFFGSNRRHHREFWPDLPQEVHDSHIIKSQKILEDFFEKNITIFVPPGNIWSYKTYLALVKTNIKKVISNKYVHDEEGPMDGVEFIDDKKENFLCFHDKELEEQGAKWLKEKIKNVKK